ncbi:MAG: phosphoenolpyruvate synthase/pyruvate phosphate dikinase, partial [Bacteroidetes bacterium]|nr:phosphoenolpyruvate synthase/pyruvate phosphate dikinase [Bacteroidota bacterium]
LVGQKDSKAIDNIFLWCCGAELLVAIVKNFEDHFNVVADTARAMVRVIIYIEDSPADRSFFLPLIYKEVVLQTQSVLDESLNEKHRLLRMRARPKVLMATNYEEARSLFESYKPFVFGIISDARFSRNGEVDPRGGLIFLEKVRSQIPDLPLLLLSAEESNKKKALDIPAVFINKMSPTITDELHEFFNDHLGFGDFIFKTPEENEICRARSIGEFEEMLKVISDESLFFHAERNHFSNWIMARAEVALARRLHKEYISRIESLEDMRADLVFKVHALRKLRQKGVVTKFKRKNHDPKVFDFVKIGEGSMGGKARGLAFMWAQLQNVHEQGSVLSEIDITIPKTCVIAADGFDDFIAGNNLVYLEGESDDEIIEKFLQASLPPWLHQDLWAFLGKC